MIRKILALAALCFLFASCNNIFFRLAGNNGDDIYALIAGEGYVVTFDKNGGDTEAKPKAKTIKPPASSVDRLPAQPACSGYIFLNWNTEADGSGTVFSASTAVESSLTVYAQWKELPPGSFIVTFDKNGGDTEAYPQAKAVTPPAATVDSLPEPPARKGFLFTGWNTGADGSGENFTGSSVVTASVTVFAQWLEIRPDFIVTFNRNGGDSPAIPETITVKFPATTVGQLPVPPDLWGYSFTGWNTRADGSGTEFTGDTFVGASLTVYAQWRSNFFTVTYYANGGDGTVPAAQTAEADSVVILPSGDGLSKDGFVFGGWNTDSSGTGITYGAGTFFQVSSDTALYAKWNPSGTVTFTVSFDSRGGSAVTSQIVNSGGTAVRPADPVRNGYLFEDWYGDPLLSSVYSFSDPVTGSVTLYAGWRAIGYTVNYDKNAGDAQGYTAGSVHTYDAEQALSANGFSREGYVFTGWNTRADGGGASYADREIVKNLSAADGAVITLFAKWLLVPSDSFVVVFNTNGGSPAPAAQAVAEGGKVSEPAAVYKTGSVFLGWYEDESLSALWNFNSDTVSGSLTLYAGWDAASYTVVYDKNAAGASGNTPDSVHTYDVGKALNGNGFTRTGYSFIGWTSRSDGTGAAYSDGQTVINLSAVNNSMVTLYAQWNANVYTVRYDKNAVDAAGTMADSYHTYDIDKTLTANAYVRGGYAFTGWNTAAGGGGSNYSDGQVVRNLTVTAGDSVVLYAQWVSVYTVTFNGNGAGGTAPSPLAVPEGSGAALPGQGGLSNPGYLFSGWNTDASGTGTDYGAGSTFTPGGDITLFAKWTAITYTVVYNANGGSGTTAGSVHTYDAAKNLSANGFTFTGYTFAGWNSQSGGGGTAYTDGQSVVNLSSVNNAVVNLYAQWNAITYTVAYNANGGSGTMPDSTHTYGVGKALSANAFTPSGGFIFARWNTQAGGGGTSYEDGEWVLNLRDTPGAVTLYAQWESSFTVTFDADGGSPAPAPQFVANGNRVTEPPSMTKTGSAFDGWYRDGAFTTRWYFASDTVSGNMTLYAKWIPVYTVTFDANGAGGSTPAPQTVNAGSGITLPGQGGLSVSGFTFGGWNTNAAGTGTNYSAGASYTPAGNVTLYAKWDPVPQYTVTFDANGAGGSPPAPLTVNAGSGITLPGQGGLSVSGFTFGGWNTNAAGTGTNYSAGSSYTPAGNVTLYAKWDAVLQYTVTFDANGAGGSTPAPQTVTAGSSVMLPGQGGLSMSGYNFNGWNTNAAGTGTNYSAGASYTPAGNVTLYAKWDAVPQYTVTFDANGAGGPPPAPQTVTAGSSVMLPGQGGLSMSGYNFNGWNTNAAGTGTNYSAGSSYTPPGNVTLYARWTSTVTFDANGGGGSPPAPQTVNAGSGITLPGQGGLSITGFTFGGWNTNAAGTGTNYSAGALYTLAGNITLYAKWDAVPQYTVSFNINGAAGTTPAALTQYEGASVTLPGGGGFSRPGYSFSGWNTNTLGSGTNYGAGSSYTVNADITLYARWVINYTVTFNINGATGSTPAPVTAAAGSLVTLPGNSGFSMDDYIFAGWNTEPDGSGWQVSSPMPVIISMTLYAMWEPANLAFMGLGGPAASVSWYELAMFSNELSLEEGLEPVYAINGGTQAAVSADFSRNGYRLPSRAEWEAVKRGDGLPGKIEWDRFHSGDGTVTIPKLAANGKDYFGMGFRLVRKANGQ